MMSQHSWHFFRIGGFDQVSIETGADLLALPQLDQKLWAALSCPVKDVEFDEKTLEYLDSDHDGHIRAPEIIEAVTWVCSVLKDPEYLIKGAEGLPLSAFNDETDEGKELLSSARQILKNMGKEGSQVITEENTGSEENIFAHMKFNGDGVVTIESVEDEGLKSVINDIINTCGSDTDRNGQPGISQERADQFFAELEAYGEWRREGDSILVIGDGTETAFQVISGLKGKIQDYFTRCNLAAFDEKSSVSLNPSDAEYEKIASLDLSETSPLAAFPIALAGPDRSLPLSAGINPAWSVSMSRFREDVVKPLLGDRETLAASEWGDILSRLAPYEEWVSAKPATSVEGLGPERVAAILAGGYKQSINDLITKDLSFAPEANAVSSVDKLVRYCRYLHTFINNFVTFRDFYSREAKATFQAGTLYLDSRSCDLCVKVNDVAAHTTLSNLSRVYLVYCACVRRGGNETMTIAAAFTAGDSDQLIVGRNGVFYDRKGQDWDAAIVRIIEHPISIRQAFWMPYKQAGRMVSEQLMKLAAARSKASEDKLAASVMQAGAQTAAGKPPVEKAFDAGRFAGIFAAIGLAIGAIGTAIASILTGLLRMPWWQLPLVIIGLMFLISGPSMIIAWFKLKKRNLGPILDANGWAVNARARINIKFGRTLTSEAKLPEGAERSLIDPYADKKRPWSLYVLIILLIVGAIAFWKLGYF